MIPDVPGRKALPEDVRSALDDFTNELGLDIRLWRESSVDETDGERVLLYPAAEQSLTYPPDSTLVCRQLSPREGPTLALEIRGPSTVATEGLANALRAPVERIFDAALEILFFTYEVSERYEEINLLYSISETLGSVLEVDEAARIIESAENKAKTEAEKILLKGEREALERKEKADAELEGKRDEMREQSRRVTKREDVVTKREESLAVREPARVA